MPAALTCEDYTLTCGELMRKARNRLDHGAGVVVLDRLPVETWRESQARKVFGCGTLLGRTVSQSIHGEMMVSVRDTGVHKQISVRGSEPTTHSDRTRTTPLTKVRPTTFTVMFKANSGGISQFISFYASTMCFVTNTRSFWPDCTSPSIKTAGRLPAR